MATGKFLSEMFGRIRGWARQRLAHLCSEDATGVDGSDGSVPGNRRIRLLICACIFSVALGARVLCWQDNYAELLETKPALQGLAFFYHDEARRIAEDGGYLFPRGYIDPGDARMVIHPPGYPIIMTVLFRLSDGPNARSKFAEADKRARALQIIMDSVASAMAFVIACELAPLAVAIIAGLLVALSPHLCYYSLLVAPDSLAILPILFAIYFAIRAIKRPLFIRFLAAGAMIGLSCWLRSNALLLAPFLAVVIGLVFGGKKGWRYSAAMVGACLVVISPITIRNFMVYKKMIPLSLGAGITLVEGIADYDREGRHGMPQTDRETAERDAEWHNREDYRGNIWVPDGVERDGERMRRGVEVIRSNPIWFGGVMIRRMASMLRYNDFQPQDTSFTTIAPDVLASPNFGHRVEDTREMTPSWSSSASELMASGTIISPQAEASFTDNQTLKIMCDNSNYGEQFASTFIPVRKNTDYVLKVTVKLEQGPVEIKVGTADPRIVLASALVPETERKRNAREKAREADRLVSENEREMTELLISFASGEQEQVRLLFYNNGSSPAPKSIEVRQTEMFEVGPTPNQWTRYPRAVIRGLQKNIFKTGRMQLLIVMGVFLLALARRFRTLLILLATPAYYLLVQSAFHTEYRYTLAIHPFLFVLAAVALYSLAVAIGQGARAAYKLATRNRADWSSGKAA